MFYLLQFRPIHNMSPLGLLTNSVHVDIEKRIVAFEQFEQHITPYHFSGHSFCGQHDFLPQKVGDGYRESTSTEEVRLAERIRCSRGSACRCPITSGSIWGNYVRH